MEPRRLLPALALVAGLLACASSPAAAQVETYCESTITSPRILGCIECLNSTKHCYYCNFRRSAIWTGDPPVLTECRAMSDGAPCQNALFPVVGEAQPEKDPNCQWCELTTTVPSFPVNKCVRCLRGYGVGPTGKCVPVTGTAPENVANCKVSSMNKDCVECHFDGTCKRCPLGTLPLLFPMGAIMLNAGVDTQCRTRATLSTLSKQFAGVDVTTSLYPMCGEVDYEFNCAACMPWGPNNHLGWGPTRDPTNPNKIICTVNVGVEESPQGRDSNCHIRRPFMAYCLKCDPTGLRCLPPAQGGGCTASRSIDPDGLCSFNCKAMWGIGCKTCNAAHCLTLDPKFAAGR